MNLREIHLLQQVRGGPAVTITLPTHRTTPENQQDIIRIKNLVKQAMDRLLGMYSKREIEPLLLRLSNMVETIDFHNVLDGLALFANADFVRAVYLPFTLKERIIVAESFFTRDLIYALNRTPRYWVLVLSEKPTRLYEGVRDDLIEIREGGFPIVHEGPGGEQPLPGGFGIRKSAMRDERHRQFFRSLDEAFKPFLAEDSLPLVLVGVERYIAFFKEVSGNTKAVLTTLIGSHDKTSAYELAKLVWPLVEENLNEQRQQVFRELDLAVSNRKYVSGVGEAWRLAKEGRGKLLLVEEDFHFPARLDENGQLIPADDPTAPDAMEDAVDIIIETVLRQQGKVVFVGNGNLDIHQQIALILRY